MHVDFPSYDINNNMVENASYTIYTIFSSFKLKVMPGEPASSIFHKSFGLDPEGNIANKAVNKADYDSLIGVSALHLLQTVEKIATDLGMSEDEVAQSLESSLEFLRTGRKGRPRPPINDLAITCWNSLAISSLARPGAAMHRSDYLKAAIAARIPNSAIYAREHCARRCFNQINHSTAGVCAAQ